MNFTHLEKRTIPASHLSRWRKPNAICEGILQTRLYEAKNNNKFQYVFGDIFEFGIGKTPLELQIEPELDDLKLEFSYIYQVNISSQNLFRIFDYSLSFSI
jgi:hypothetical protein